MKRKPKILFSTEFSKLNTGYACIANNLLNEFHKTGKYEIAEHARYCKGSDPYHQSLLQQIPWRVYPNLPEGEAEEHIYRAHPANEFGRWKHDVVCLDFQPDIVVSWGDYWMDSHIDQSCLRRFYKTVMMPTVDAVYQNDEWIDLYCRTDYILTYTKFAERVLAQEGGGLIPLRGVATPSVDINTYKFSGNRAEHKKKFGLDPNSIIIGMVARNQRRKLYPDFGSAFADFLEKANFKGTENVYLYWHTSHPDVGWDIPKYIKNLGLSHKVLMTYFCQRCRNWFPSFYQDAATLCRFCGAKTATLSNSQMGIDTTALSAVYNFMDLYVQFITNEGLGIPTVEAAACGCPITGTYYSGTEDLIDNLNGYPLNPITTYLEAETTRQLCFPSIDELTEYIEYFTRLPASVRHNMSVKTEQLTRKHYGGWEGVAKQWMRVFDSIKISEQNQWMAPPEIVNLQGIQPPGQDKVNDEGFITWCVGDVLLRSDWINSYAGLKMLRDLGYGRTAINNLGFFVSEMSQLGGRPEAAPCNRDTILKQCIELRSQYNMVESMRGQYIQNGKIQP